MRKRFLSMALILCLVVTLFPAAAPAATEILVDGTSYTCDMTGLQAAINKAANGDTVKLGGNIDLGPTGVSITDKTIILELNGQTITYSGTDAAVTLSGAADLTVQDSGSGTGKITSASKCFILKNAGSGTLTLAGGTIEGTSTGADQTFGIANNSGRLNITGGTVQTTNVSALLINKNSGDVTISGGTLKTTDWTTIRHIGYTAKLTISGNSLIECNSIDSNARVISITEQAPSLEIQGGRIIGNFAISCYCPVEISGGYIIPKIATTQNLTITGGFLQGGPSVSGSGTCFVNGGYISGNNNCSMKNAAGDLLKMYTVLLRDADNNTIKITAVTSLSTVDLLGYTYGLNDVNTDAGGYLCVWLPAGKTGVSVTAGGSTYSGAVTLNAGSGYYQGTLRLPSQNPAADVTSVAKTTTSQASVDFTLTTAPTGTWKVYADAAAADAIAGVTAALSGTTLTLTASDGDIEAMPYYVTVTEPNKNESARLALTVQDAPVVVNAAAPVITNNLSTTQVEYNQNAAAVLDATATVTDGGIISYAWYCNTTNSTVGATPLGVTTATYTPSTAAAGTTYYFCVVTNTNNAATETKTAQTTSAIAHIKVNALVNAAAPVITSDLNTTQVEYNQNAAATALDATATAADGGIISYAWYSNTTNSTDGATALGVTTATYTPSTATAGTIYYFCVVTNTNNAATGTKTIQTTSAIANIKVNALVNAAAPVITNDLSNTQVEYNQNAAATSLDATATVTDDGTISYAWYSNTTNSTAGATSLGVTTATYTPSTAAAGTTYYFCVVTNTNNAVNGTTTAQTTSAIANIKVSALVNAAAPVITSDLSNTQVEYSQKAAATALNATATAADGGTISYAWYSNTTNSTVGATALGVTTATYTPSTAAAGATYYYCVVTNTNNAVNGTTTTQTTSAIANIKVNAAGGGGSSHSSSTVSEKPVITVSEVKSEIFSNAEDIKVEADVNSAFGQSVAVKITDGTESQKEIFSLTGANDKVYPFDISLYSIKSNEKIQPKDGYSVKITLPVPEELLGDREKIKVVYGKDGSLETLKSELAEKDGKWYITFEAVHFSPYALIISVEPAKPWANPFSDVKEGDWYYSAVQYAAQNGLMKGTGSNTFSPELVTNRGMIATILYNLDGSGETEQSSFKDVKPGAYYANAVAWAQKKSIIAGYGNGMFGPDDSITREQLAAMLWKYAGSPAAADSKGLAAFQDAGEISSYAKNALTWANQIGIMNGKGGGLLAPKGKATRAEAAQIMQNFLQKSGLMN